MPLVVLLVPVVGVAVIGAAILLAHRATGREAGPAAPGTPQLDGRLPVGLWPANGTEPIVEPGIRGWHRMVAHLYHRDTVIDDAALARAIVLSTYTRRAADARREVAFEVSVLRGAYDPAVIAAAWLAPQMNAPEAADERNAYRVFGIGGDAIAILEAAELLDADTGRLAPEWGQQVGLDPAHPDFATVDQTGLDAIGRARLSALMIDAALDRIHARQPR